ncbi:hypothetical protein BDV93DRAFT_546391 [Ceratobasidium sp. AG-I]|nr:hypothetical protein BDV93DRAFT_546391 [Ceratobasidium sp. AG-I]
MSPPPDQPATKKRKRMHYACVECNRRKHKCDRKIPCAPCVQRGIAESCRPFEDGDEHGDLRTRLVRVEQLVEGLLARENPGSGTHPVPDSDSRSRTSPSTVSVGDRREHEHDRDEHLDGGLTGEAGNYFGGNALPSVTSTSIEAEVRGNANGSHQHAPAVSARTTQANLALRQAIADGGTHPDILLSLLSELPPKDDISALLEIFFRDINPVRFPLPQRDIRRAFDDLNSFTWGSAREDGDDGASQIIFLPLLFMIIATTTFCLPLSMSKRIDVKSQAKRYFHSYRRAASVASLLPATTTLLSAHLLATRFLIISRTPADAWSLLGATLRLAQALGLHRDGARLGLPPTEAERRRRLWAHLFYADASMCLMLGRPMGVRVGDCDTLAPGQVRLEEDGEDEVGDGADGEKSTRWNFIALRHALAQITSKVVEHFQDLAGGRHYDTVIALDKELVAFWEALPAAYRLDGGEKTNEPVERGRVWQSNGRETDRESRTSRSSDRGTIDGSEHPDDTMDDSDRTLENGSPAHLEEPIEKESGAYPMLATHRFMINTEVQYVRIALHRPYVLRAGEKYDPSRTACFDAARIDRRAREIFRREVSWPEHRARRDHMGGLYRLFNSTMILGIALLLNPAGPNAAELRGYLDDFIQIHAAQTAHDDTSTREVKIIQLFRAKADDALRLRSPVRPGQTESSTPQMTSHPPNMIPPNAPRRQSSSRGFSMDSHHGQVFPPTNGASHTSRRSRSRASVSSVMIPTPTVHIDNPPLLPGAISTSPTTSTAFPNLSFTPPITTFTMSNNRRSSSATLSPTTPREAQSLLSPAPRAVSPLFMLGLGNGPGSNTDGTPPTLNAMPLADDTQALFDQASWQYALANPSWDWTSAGSTLGLGGMSDIPGLDAFGFGLGGMGVGGYGAALGGSIGPGSVASGNGDEGSMGDGTSPSVVVTQMDGGTVEEMLAPGSEGRVRSGSSGGKGKGRAPEGWGYWEGLVDAIVNQQGIGGK